MDADLDLLLIAVECMAEDVLPQGREREDLWSGAGQVVYRSNDEGHPSDARFLRAACPPLGHLFPQLPERSAFPGYASRA